MRVLLWAAFALFVGVALVTSGDAQLFQFDTATDIARLFLIAIWLGFLAYSIICSSRDNLFQTIAEMNKRHWGRQIGIDLYISVFLSVGLVYLVTGSVFQTILWGIAFIPFANLAILLFLILHLDEIVTAFTSVPITM